MPKIKNISKIYPYVAILTTVIFFGLSFISIKIAVREIPPLTLALIRFIMAILILLPVKYKEDKHFNIDKKDIKRIALSGFIGITAYFFMENTGVKLTAASSAALIVSMAPIAAIILDRIINKNRLSKKNSFGVLVSIIGTYFVVTANGQLDFSSSAFLGNIFMVGSVLCWASYTMLSKSLHKKYSNINLTFYQHVFGTIFLIPLSFIEKSQWHMFSARAFLHTLFLAACCSALGYLMYNYALRRLNVASTTLFLNLIPVVAVVFSYLVLDERILNIQLFGGMITILGIIIVNLNQKRIKSPKLNKKFEAY